MELKWQKYKIAYKASRDNYSPDNDDIYYTGWIKELCDEQDEILLTDESLHANILFVSFIIKQELNNREEFTLSIYSPVCLSDARLLSNPIKYTFNSIQECKDHCKYVLLNFATIVSENFNID